jgi:aspartate-semialdehyde dehydrogenase
VFYGHSEAVHIETREPISIEAARELLANSPGLTLMGDHELATPVEHGAGTDPVFVSRLRKDISHPNGLNMWVVADNVRKGAALNSVQIAELLLAHL